MHAITIRDVGRVAPTVSTMGNAELRDSALAVAPRIAPAGAHPSAVAGLAAALIADGAGENPVNLGLPEITPEIREAASCALRDLRESAIGLPDAAAERFRAITRALDRAEDDVRAVTEAVRTAEAARDEAKADRDREHDARVAAEAARDELAAKVAQLEAALAAAAETKPADTKASKKG